MKSDEFIIKYVVFYTPRMCVINQRDKRSVDVSQRKWTNRDQFMENIVAASFCGQCFKVFLYP